MTAGVILQPSYIPWRGYFDQIRRADVFVFYDCVQYDRRGWRNRNRIKTPRGTEWLTVPVQTSGRPREELLIRDVAINYQEDWVASHLGKLAQCYAEAPYYQCYFPLLRHLLEARPARLADLTIPATIHLAAELGIRHTTFLRSSSLQAVGRKTDRLVDICLKTGITHYLSGPSARDYIECDKFAANDIALEFMEYNYPEYEQPYPPYDPHVSIVDLLFMQGPQSPVFIWATKTPKQKAP